MLKKKNHLISKEEKQFQNFPTYFEKGKKKRVNAYILSSSIQ